MTLNLENRTHSGTCMAWDRTGRTIISRQYTIYAKPSALSTKKIIITKNTLRRKRKRTRTKRAPGKMSEARKGLLVCVINCRKTDIYGDVLWILFLNSIRLVSERFALENCISDRLN